MEADVPFVVMISALSGAVVGFLIGFLSSNWNAHRRWEELEASLDRQLTLDLKELDDEISRATHGE